MQDFGPQDPCNRQGWLFVDQIWHISKFYNQAINASKYVK